MPKQALPVVVANPEATYDCIFGRGCDGLCCRNGRPSVAPAEEAAIRAVLSRVLPHLRPEARALAEAEGFLSRRKKLGQPMIRVVGGWCLFFNGGCVLHKIGAADGDAYQYKPTQCALFPLEKAADGRWFVRQWGYDGEEWDLFCLDPKASERPALESLAGELELAGKLDAAAGESQKSREGAAG
jgi:Fe-S-cluster containining protein